MSQVSYINTENLVIARENMGLDTHEATQLISKAKADLVKEWETGEKLPTWKEVAKLSKVYSVPELLFFASTPLTRNKMVPDYRVGIDRNAKSELSVKKLINLVRARQRWLERNFANNGLEKNPLLGSAANISDPSELARLIQTSLEIDLAYIKSLKGEDSKKKALLYLIRQAEAKGIFVGKTISFHRISVKTLRGLFIANEYCPFIVINRQDAVAAQIFSFVHELTHFFRKTDSLSNSLNFHSDSEPDEEILCNKVAVTLLLPAEEFTAAYYSKSEIDDLSDVYKVSALAIFYRLKQLKKIQKEFLSEIESQIRSEMERNVALKESRKSKGGNYINSMKDSNGSRFNKIVAQSYFEQRIGYVEAAKLLRFSPEKA